MSTKTTYKLFRIGEVNAEGTVTGLSPLYVKANTVYPLGVWLEAEVGDLVDETHVKAKGCGGKLSLRPRFHSTRVPFTDWIGKRAEDGTLIQRAGTVWCECQIRGDEITVTERYGLRDIPDGYYRFRTNSKQKEPWYISRWLKIVRILPDEEVDAICLSAGYSPQARESA